MPFQALRWGDQEKDMPQRGDEFKVRMMEHLGIFVNFPEEPWNWRLSIAICTRDKNVSIHNGLSLFRWNRCSFSIRPMLWHSTLSCCFYCLHSIPKHQFPANALEKAMENGPSAWSSCHPCRKTMTEFLALGFRLVSGLAVVSSWGGNQRMKDLWLIPSPLLYLSPPSLSYLLFSIPCVTLLFWKK